MATTTMKTGAPVAASKAPTRERHGTMDEKWRELTPDICVIGAGSGGLSVAAACASFGVDVVLIEKGEMGGDCLNYGCVPSKALLAAGKAAQHARHADRFGVSVGKVSVDFRKVHDHVHDVIATIAPMDSQERFEGLGVTVIRARAHFVDARTVEAGATRIRARRFVVATGSQPFVPPIPGLDEVEHFTNETVFDRTRTPDHLIVVGGGPIGLEMAQAHRRLGAEVTVIEGARALGNDDPELAGHVVDALRDEGIVIREGTSVERVEKSGVGVRVYVKAPDGATSVEGDVLLVATGRHAVTEGLGLEEAGIETTRKGIKVTKGLRTTNKRVYAIGDVADPPNEAGEHKGGLQFTHVAGYHAGLVTRALLFRLPVKEDRSILPWATYTEPALAHVGLREQDAGHVKDLRVLRWPFAENDRALAERQSTGLVKVLADKKGRILGASIVGANAGEQISLWALAVSQKMTLKDIAGYVPPYPTMTEAGKRAATSFFAPMTKRDAVRKVVGALRVFG